MASHAEQLIGNINLANFAKATDLKKRLWFTLGALVIFRLLTFVPLPGIDPRALDQLFQTTQGGVLDLFNIDRKSTRLNSSNSCASRMQSSALKTKTIKTNY